MESLIYITELKINRKTQKNPINFHLHYYHNLDSGLCNNKPEIKTKSCIRCIYGRLISINIKILNDIYYNRMNLINIYICILSASFSASAAYARAVFKTYRP